MSLRIKKSFDHSFFTPLFRLSFHRAEGNKEVAKCLAGKGLPLFLSRKEQDGILK
jgi:hypothetical protein